MYIFRTSVKWPATAAAAAIAGLTKWVRPAGPCLPSKLRLDVEAQRSSRRKIDHHSSQGTLNNLVHAIQILPQEISYLTLPLLPEALLNQSPEQPLQV